MIECPSQSLYLNPIEHIWEYMERELRKVDLKNLKDLRRNLKKIWKEISIKEIIKRIRNMPPRLEAVLRSKGGPTAY